MLTSGSSYPTKGLPGETDPFDPNARTTTSSFGDDPFEQPEFAEIVDDFADRSDREFESFVNNTLQEEEFQKFIRDNFLRSDETEEDPRGPVPEVNIDEDVFQMILDSILGRANDIPPEILGDNSRLRSYLLEELPVIYQESVTNAQEIADVLSSGDIESLEEIGTPDPLTLMVLEQGAMQFAGGPISTATPPGRDETLVITGGAGVSVTTEDILKTGGRIFGETVQVAQRDTDGNLVLDANGNPILYDEYQPGILDAMVPYIPGISLPDWMPSAGVIFLPTVGEAVNKLEEIVRDSGLSEALEEGDFGQVLNELGGIIVDAGSSAAGVLQEKVGKIVAGVLGTITDPTKAGSVLGGIIGATFPSIPSWLPPLITDPRVYGAVRGVLTQNFSTPEDQFPPINEEIETDPTLMFTNRGNNYFVSSEGDEYFQLAESEDLDFELNGQYTREQLDNTGLETIGSGTYQSLIDDLSFHALEEDIYQYSLEDLRTRYEEEGGIIPGDWKEMDDESKYGFLLDDYFEIPTQVSDPDRGEPPTEPEPPVTVPEPEPEPPIDQPEPEPEPPVDQPEPDPDPEPQPDPDPDPDPDVTSVVEGLFADFLEQLDTEFTGQQDQINTIINNFVETLPDFDAMPTMADIAEYFEINGVTLSQQNFDRIREELSNAGYLTQEQLTEALQGVATPEQVQQAIEGAGFATPEQVIQALAEAGYATPDDITTALANSNLVTEDRMLLALGEAGYATPEQVEQIVTNAVSNIVIPEGATTEEVRQLIQEAVSGLPAGISLDDVSGVVNEAIANIDFPPGLSSDDVRGIVDSFGFATSTDVQAGFDDLNDRFDDAVNGLATQFSDQEAEFLASITGLEASFIQSLASVEGGLSAELEMLGTDIISLQQDVAGRFDEFEQTVGQQLTQAEQDRIRIEQSLNDKLDLQAEGQIAALTEAEARLLSEITGGDAAILQELSTQTGGLQQQLTSLGLNMDDVRSSLGEQITTGLSQAQQDRVRIEQGLYNALQLQSQGQAVELNEAEARLLAEITGGDAALLQEMSSQTGALENQLTSLGLNLNTVQQNLSQDISDLQQFTGFGFSEAAQQRQNLQQALIVANADITQLSSDMFAQFQAQNENVEELFEGTDVNIEALQQGQISQAQAFAQYAQSTDVRLGLGEQQREEILTRQEEFEQIYGEGQEELQEQIQAGNILTALAAGGMFGGGGGGGVARRPYEEFMKGITYRPREAPQLAIKTPAVDYNEEAQQLLMRTRRRGMLA